jgi:hypothetical protein
MVINTLTFVLKPNDHIMHESIPLQALKIILFLFKEIKMSGHILESIDQLAHIVDNVCLKKEHLAF